MKLDYLLLTFLLFCIFTIAGYEISREKSKSTKKYWEKLIFPILLFTFIEGLRYNRGVDYLHYVDIYHLTNLKELDQPVFTLFNYILQKLDIPFYGAFMCYSLFYIIAASLFISNFKRIANYLFPLLLFSTLLLFEAFIRQYFAISFLLISLHFIINKKWIKGFTWGILGVLSHSSIALVFPVYFLFRHLNKPINIYISVGLYVFFAYIYDMRNVDSLSPYLKFIDFGKLYFNQYIENSELWFSSTAIDSAYKQSFIAKLGMTIFDLSIIASFYFLYAKGIFSKYRKADVLCIFYNLFVIGALSYQAFFQLEIFRRIVILFYSFNFILIAFILKEHKNYIGKNRYIIICIYCIYAYIIIWYFKYIVFSENQLFIWDINRIHLL